MGIGGEKRKTVGHIEGGRDFYFSSSLFLGQANTFHGYDHQDQVQESPVSEEDKLRLVQPCVRACNKCDGLWGVAPTAAAVGMAKAAGWSSPGLQVRQAALIKHQDCHLTLECCKSSHRCMLLL